MHTGLVVEWRGMHNVNFENKRRGTMTKGQRTMTEPKGSAGERGNDQWQCSMGQNEQLQPRIEMNSQWSEYKWIGSDRRYRAQPDWIGSAEPIYGGVPSADCW